jgi:hypothetical protein
VGATSWRYYTSYRPDPEEALQALRSEVFARGDYVDVTGPLADVLRQTARRFGLDPDSPEVRGQIENDLRMQRAVETGDMRALSRADRACAQRVRGLAQLAGQLGGLPVRSTERPRSIDELLERSAECGTHSILDIEHVAPRPRFGAAAPLSAEAVRRTFGSAQPTHEQVEENWPDVAERLRRWQARHLVVYRDGHAAEYAFIGCSGD